MEEWIIADSGGTKTDWCRVSHSGILETLRTESYHPLFFSPERLEAMKQFWQGHSEWLQLPVYFFGSGCYRLQGKMEVNYVLSQLGFEKIKVDSDVHAAAIAVLGNNPGWAAILGTGSVLIEWNGEKVVSLIGGKGHIDGDEGSGYYFGRLLLMAYEQNELSTDARRELEAFLHRNPGFQPDLADKAGCAVLAANPGNHPEFDPIHRKNILIFLQTHTENLPARTEIHFVGSYAAKQAGILTQILTEHGFSAGQIIGKPIERLVEQSGLFID